MKIRFTTATIHMDDRYWIGIFQETDLIQRYGPFESREAADKVGPKIAKKARELLRDHKIKFFDCTSPFGPRRQ
jgi:hypothetical protein